MNIGHFSLKGTHYEGVFSTLGITAELTLEPNKHKTEANKAPDFKAFQGTREIGYAYRESFESQDDGRIIKFLSVKLDDPAFPYPIYAKVFTESQRDELPLVWSRPKPKKA